LSISGLGRECELGMMRLVVCVFADFGFEIRCACWAWFGYYISNLDVVNYGTETPLVCSYIAWVSVRVRRYSPLQL